MDVIEKKSLKFKPNMPDYEEAYKNFRWEDAEKEIDFFEDGTLNAAYNTIDRHADDKTALIYEGDQGIKEFSYADLKKLSNQFANLLKSLGIKKGDRIFLFLPRIPELYISFLGILKTGAIAGTMFAAFGEAALKDRLSDSGAKIVITNSKLKQRIYGIKKDLPELKYLIITDEDVEKDEVSFKKIESMSEDFEIEKMDSDDFAFMLYTSGTTGKPKGVMHRHYAIVQQHITAKYILDLKEDDMYWCTADPGWVTGISYGILGPFSNHITSFVYEGRFDAEKWYSLLEKHKITVWYTAPTAIRMLMKAGNKIIRKYDLSNLRYMCSVGEPLNPEAIKWGEETLKLAFHDNWWQTETGSILIANYACMKIKLGSMGRPFPGITATIIDGGKELRPGEEGNLAIKPGWPSMMKAIWNNEEKYKSYFENDWYITGDRATRDKEGYFWFVGRADDVIKTAGERVGPFEVESALVEHPAIAEAGVIGKPDKLRGEIIKAFVVLNPDFKQNEELKEEIKLFVKKHLAGHAYPREIDFVDSLPKTRSGKIMRRVLKAKELGQPVGDTSTLEEY